MTRGETKLGTVFVTSPIKDGFPNSRTDTLTANVFVGDEIFKVSSFSNDWSHDDGESGNADDAALVIDSE